VITIARNPHVKDVFEKRPQAVRQFIPIKIVGSGTEVLDSIDGGFPNRGQVEQFSRTKSQELVPIIRPDLLSPA
jgi:hypothetical protein